MNCKICRSKSKRLFTVEILSKHKADCFFCDACGFLQTEEPFWLTEAYADSITLADTGILERSLHFSRIVPTLLYILFGKDKAYLDYAGGYGTFVRRMRDLGFDFYWSDPHSKNLMARGFEYSEGKPKIELVTLFEAFEHFVEPMSELEKILQISKNIIFSTTLLPRPTPNPSEWYYYAFEYGQHVSFYSKESFDFIARIHDLHYIYFKDNIHLFLENKPNHATLKLLKNRIVKRFISRYVERNMKSRTYSDHDLFNRTAPNG